MQSVMWSLQEFWWTVVAQSRHRANIAVNNHVNKKKLHTHRLKPVKRDRLTFTVKCRLVGKCLWAPVTSMCWPIACWDPLVGNLFHLVLVTNKSENVAKKFWYILSVTVSRFSVDRYMYFKCVLPFPHNHHTGTSMNCRYILHIRQINNQQ
jgi:hypothetical protein